MFSSVVRKIAGAFLLLFGCYIQLVCIVQLLDLRTLMAGLSTRPAFVWGQASGSLLVIVALSLLGILLIRVGWKWTARPRQPDPVAR